MNSGRELCAAGKYFPQKNLWNLEITGMNTKASFGNKFRSKLRGIIPSAARDCSTYQFRYAADDI